MIWALFFFQQEELLEKKFEIVLNYLNETRGFDFSGCRPSMIERRVRKRLSATRTKDCSEYLRFVQKQADELDNLIDVLTINVSRFFRDTLTFEYIAARALPAIVFGKKGFLNHSIRVWSAGCAMGEEPYSMAILIHEFLEKESLDFQVNIFATDIDGKILKKAQNATYPFESIKDTKYQLLKKYFTSEGESFLLIPEIRKMVSFSAYDMLDKKSYAPPESIFGNFDIVFCRNVLIYFDTKHQDKIFDKLYRSLSKNGYLVLGEAEIPSIKYQRRFKKVNECCHIYQKR